VQADQGGIFFRFDRGKHRGFNKTRADRVDADALAGVLQRGALGHAHQCMLGRHIGGRSGPAVAAQDRGHVDDGATALGLHRVELVFHAVEDSVQVHRQHAVPLIQRIFAGFQAGATDTGIVHRHVQAAVVLDDLLDAGGDRVRVGDIQHHRLDVAAQRQGHRLRAGQVHIGSDDLVAFFGQLATDRRTDTGGGAGDQGDAGGGRTGRHGYRKTAWGRPASPP